MINLIAQLLLQHVMHTKARRICSYSSYIKPQHVQQVLCAVNTGNVVIAPSDSGYVLLCRLGDKDAMQKIRYMRTLDAKHPLTLFCHGFEYLARYARIDNVQFRLIKRLLPGMFTCILSASHAVPKLIQDEKRKTVGIRLPDNPILCAILTAHQSALMGVSLFDETEADKRLDDISKSILNTVDTIIDVGELPLRPTTILDLTEMPPVILRQGAGDASAVIE